MAFKDHEIETISEGVLTSFTGELADYYHVHGLHEVTEEGKFRFAFSREANNRNRHIQQKTTIMKKYDSLLGLYKKVKQENKTLKRDSEKDQARIEELEKSVVELKEENKKFAQEVERLKTRETRLKEQLQRDS